MLQIKESVFATRRTSSRMAGETYDSGFMKLSELKSMLSAAENAGLDAVGMQPKYVKTVAKGEKKGWEGTIIEIVPFKLKSK